MKSSFLALISSLLIISSSVSKGEEPIELTVYKTPTCGCCKKWIAHLEENQMISKAVDLDSLSEIKADFGIEGKYRSCHTGNVVTEKGSFVFEGHVPAKHIKAFLASPPENAIGLSVPGMPIGSPGMEVGDRKDYYQVLVMYKDGSSSVFAHENGS